MIKKLLSIVLCLAALSIPAAAADTGTVDYCGVNIVVDGARLCPKDADGNPVEPFIWNGTTYLPVRSVANTLGLDVGWEPGTVKLTSGKERTAAIGKPIESKRSRVIPMGGQDTKVTLDGRELDLNDAGGKPVTPIISGGVTYLPVRAIADALEVPVLWDGENATVYLGKALEWKTAKTHSVSDGMDSTTVNTYDAAGNLLSQTKTLVFNGKTTVSTTVNTYDANGRLVKRVDRTGDEPQQICKLAYDNGGNCTTERFTFTEDGEPMHITYRHTYDAAGNRLTTVTDGGGESKRYAYDAGNRCVKEQVFWDGELDKQTLYTYDAIGNLLRETEENWFEGTVLSSWETVYTYDPDGNVLRKEFTHTDEGKVTETGSHEYTYDDRGNVLTERITDDSYGSEQIETYSYDAFDNVCHYTYCYRYDGKQQTRETTTSYLYNSGGLPTHRTEQTTGKDAVSYDFEYDGCGNLLKRTYSGITTTYEYIAIER